MPLTPSPSLHMWVHKLCTHIHIHLFMPLTFRGPVGSPPGEVKVKKWAACIDGLMRVYPILYTAGYWKIWWQCLSKGKSCDHPESEVCKTVWSLSRIDLAWGHQITYYLPPLNLRTMPSPLPCLRPTRWTGRQVDSSLWKELWDIFFSVSAIQYKVARKKKNVFRMWHIFQRQWESL